MKNITIRLFYLFIACCIFSSCEDEMDKHYKVPDWLSGSAWSVLEEKGTYSIFLKGIELSGYRPLLEGKGILTIMAPDDSSFTAYLNEKGFSDISEMNQTELKKLIGFHLLYYSYSKDKFVNFRPEGDSASDEDKEINAGLYYKFRTKSNDAPTIEYDENNGKYVTVYHLERFLPVFSYRFFSTKDIDAKSNYEYFYPNSTWTGSESFNVSNASVIEYQIDADNGYVYTINQVLEPLETIYTELETNRDYSIFFYLYNSYSTYNYDATISSNYGDGIGVDSLYLHTHGNLPAIAMEWPVSSYANIQALSSKSFSVFAPSNNALNEFFDSFWKDGNYESLGDVDELVMSHLLNQYVYSGSIVFPEQIKKGAVKNSYGMAFNFDPDVVNDKTICVNGSFYGLDHMSTPPLFSSVVGAAFQYKSCAPFLYALDGSGLLTSYTSSDVSFILLIPTEEQMLAADIMLNEYSTGKVLQINSEEGMANLSTGTMQSIVNMHSTSTTIGALPTSGTAVIPTQLAFNYWFVKDGHITTNALYNNCIEPDINEDGFVLFTEVMNNGEPWSNGKAYFYAKTDGIFTEDSSDGLMYTLAKCNDKRYPYNAFVQLMKKAGMVSGTAIPSLLDTRFIAFIPQNEVIETALSSNSIPGVTNGSLASDGSINGTIDQSILRSYLTSYFLTSGTNVITTYPYPNSTMRSASYTTLSGKKLTYTDNGSSLSIELEEGNSANIISTYDYFPFAYSDGCFHLIDQIL